jgi:hypothetical protein
LAPKLIFYKHSLAIFVIAMMKSKIIEPHILENFGEISPVVVKPISLKG